MSSFAKLREKMLLFERVVILSKAPVTVSANSTFLTLNLGIVIVNIGAKSDDLFL